MCWRGNRGAVFQMASATSSLKAARSSGVSKSSLFPPQSLCLTPFFLSHSLPNTRTDNTTHWAWWTYTSEIRALRRPPEHYDTLGWAKRLTDWLCTSTGLTADRSCCSAFSMRHSSGLWLQDFKAEGSRALVNVWPVDDLAILWRQCSLAGNVSSPCFLFVF